MNKKYLSMIGFSCVHSYIYYGNIALASTSQTKLKEILTKQKHAVGIIFHEEKEAEAKQSLLKQIHVLNVYQIDILQILTYIQKVNNATIP